MVTLPLVTPVMKLEFDWMLLKALNAAESSVEREHVLDGEGVSLLLVFRLRGTGAAQARRGAAAGGNGIGIPYRIVKHPGEGTGVAGSMQSYRPEEISIPESDLGL